MPGEFIPLNLAADWITKLWGKLQRIKSKRMEEFEKIDDVFANPFDLAKYYVEPDCQETNPADTQDEDFLATRQPIMTKVDEFLGSRVPNPAGYNQLFVLGDAGMGKTALLTMLKLMHLTSFWPNGKECVLLKLKGVKHVASRRPEIMKRARLVWCDKLKTDERRRQVGFSLSLHIS